MDESESVTEFERKGRGIAEWWSSFDGLGDRIELALEVGLEGVAT